jgi:hypothetical protein
MRVEPGIIVPITGMASDSARRRTAMKAKWGWDPIKSITLWK